MKPQTFNALSEYQSIMYIIHNFCNKKSKATFFELGCRDGKNTQAFYKHFTVPVNYYAFEPDPRNIIDIQNNKHFPPQVKLIQKAVSNTIGHMPFYCSGGYAKGNPNEYRGASSLLAPGYVRERFPFITFKQTKVETITIDHFCHINNIKTIDIIHSDIQGAEKNMLLGAIKMLHHTNFLFLEKSDDKHLYQNQWLTNDIIHHLKKYNFTVLKKFKHDILLGKLK